MKPVLNIANNNKLTQSLLMILVIIFGACFLTALLSVRSWYKPTIHLNDPSPVNIVLDKDVEVVDRAGTLEAREKARFKAVKNVGNREILEKDLEAQKQSLEQLKFVIRVARNKLSSREPHPDPLNLKISIEVQDFLMDLSEEDFSNLVLSSSQREVIEKEGFLNLDKEKQSMLVDEIYQLNEVERKYFFDNLAQLRDERQRAKEIRKSLGRSFFDNASKIDSEKLFMTAFTVQKKLLDLGIVRGMSSQKMRDNIKILYPGMGYEERILVQQLIDVSTQPNVLINWRKVEEIEKEAMDAVPPVKIKLKKGSLLADKGELVGSQNFSYLKELNMLHAKTDWSEIANNFYLISLIVLVITLFVSLTGFKQYSIQQVTMMFLVPVSVSAVVAPIAIWGVDKLALAPIATISILLTVFYAPTMAGIIVTVICFFLAKSIDMNFWQVLPQYVGSLYAIFLVRRAHQREDLTNAGTKIAMAQIITFLATIMIAVADFKVSTVLIVALLYGVGAIGSGFVSLAALPYLESGLKLVTPFKLAELSNPNQPLLKRLKEEAPGTYQHSLNVSRLTEEAGAMLGLNTELIRVGLLYHDIGKMHAPDYFIENTLGKPNPHTTLDDPQKSAEIIIAHVPEGVKLAKKANLPQAVIDFIPMHQGTTITNYFYHIAVERFGDKNVDPEDFRYPGPKPNTKETGVAMIADSTEAALKSIKDLTSEEAARDMIYKIINARLDEGELDDSGLTRADLDKVAQSFLKVWKSVNHERVQYPDDTKKAKA